MKKAHQKTWHFQNQNQMMAHTNKDKEVVDLLYSLIYDFVSMLLKDDYESLTKLSKLEKAFETAVIHLEMKASDDEKL